MQFGFFHALVVFITVQALILSYIQADRCPRDLRVPKGKCKQECVKNNDCDGKKICCKIGCFASCFVPTKSPKCVRDQERAIKKGHFYLECEEDGSFKEIQCQTKRDGKTCWRVNKRGVKIAGSEHEPLLTRELINMKLNDSPIIGQEDVDAEYEEEDGKGRRLSKCQKSRSSKKSKHVPRCNKDGSYQALQCSDDECWCVFPNGKEIHRTRKPKDDKPRCHPNFACGNRPILQRRVKRIVGGDDVHLSGSWPWMVSLFFKTKHACGASLIHPRWVITAAHCFGPQTSERPSDWQLRFGKKDLSKVETTEQWINPLKIIKHKMYIAPEGNYPGNYDVALVHLEKAVVMDDYKNLICLPDSFNYFNPGKRCVVTGWGAEQKNGTASSTLKEAWVDLVSLAQCNSLRPQGNKLSTSFICAGFKEGGIDACTMDSGGPLACGVRDGTWILAGIIGWRNDCGSKNQYGIYTNTDEIKSWIQKTIQKFE